MVLSTSKVGGRKKKFCSNFAETFRIMPAVSLNFFRFFSCQIPRYLGLELAKNTKNYLSGKMKNHKRTFFRKFRQLSPEFISFPCTAVLAFFGPFKHGFQQKPVAIILKLKIELGHRFSVGNTQAKFHNGNDTQT